MTAHVKVEALPFNRYGLLTATLVSLAPDSLDDSQGRRLHKAQLRPASAAGEAPMLGGIELRPGMAVAVEIATRRRSVFDHLWSPLVRGLHESPREPWLARTHGPGGQPLFPHPIEGVSLTTPLFRAASTLTLAALSACTQAQQPIEAQLARMQPVSVAALTGLDWPAGTLLCPLTPYQSSLPAGEPTAERVNSYLRRQRFVGEEGRWSLVVVKPGTAGDDGIEHLLFKRGDYDIVTAPRRLQDAAEAVPAGFRLQSCVPLERARVLATRARATQRVMISFGTE